MPQPSDLAARLRAATWSAHQQAAGDGFLAGLMRGTRGVDDYARLASQHLVVYRALEAAVAACDGGLVARLHDPLLERTAAIEADLEALGSAHDALPGALAYAEHLRGLAGDPVRLAAHHYTRYLGDLSGGQHIGRALAQRFGAETTGFYRFELDAKACKEAYRAALDEAGLSPAEEAALLEETTHAYARAQALHAELAEALPAVAA